MIDIEADVFDAVYNALCLSSENLDDAVICGGELVGTYVPEPEAFPHVELRELENIPNRQTADSSTTEYTCIVTYEAQVYALDKDQCRTIMAALDDTMRKLGFERREMQAVPNAADISIHRMEARYRAEVDHNKVIYRTAG